MNQLPKFIELLRIARGLTQVELAKKIGVEQATISDYERGRVDFPLSKFLTLAELLDITPEALIRVANSRNKVDKSSL